jgi:transposase
MAHQCKPAKERRWLNLILRWQQSGISVRAFCQRRRLSEPRFYIWRRLLRERGLIGGDVPANAGRGETTPTFVKVAVDAGADALSAIDLVLAQGRMLRVRPGFDPDLLRQLLRLLEEPSC